MVGGSFGRSANKEERVIWKFHDMRQKTNPLINLSTGSSNGTPSNKMAERRNKLRRQHSSISYQFDPLSAKYFCCFGQFHAKTIGVMIFFYELVFLISSAAFLFLKSASYTTKQWQSLNILMIVGAVLFSLVVLAVTIALLFMGVCYEERSLVLPYIMRQVLFVIGIVVACFMKPDWSCLAVPFGVFQIVLLLLSLGTYCYFSDIKKFQYKPSSIDSSVAFSSSISRISHKRNYSAREKISIGRARPATIDLC